MNQLSWLFAVPSFMLFLFFIAALLYVILKRSDQSSAKLFAILGVSILGFSQVSRFLFTLVLARFDPTDFMLYQGLYTIVSTLLYILAMSLIIFAVFVGRAPSAANQDSGIGRKPLASSNPYTPPVSQ